MVTTTLHGALVFATTLGPWLRANDRCPARRAEARQFLAAGSIQVTGGQALVDEAAAAGISLAEAQRAGLD